MRKIRSIKEMTITEGLFIAAILSALPINIIYSLSPLFEINHALAYNIAELFLLLALIVSLKRFPSWVSFSDLIFVMFLFSCALVFVPKWFLGQDMNDSLGRSLNSYSRAVMTLQIFWYLLGRYAISRYVPSPTTLRIFFFLILCVIAYRTNPETFMVQYDLISQDLNYLSICDFIVVWIFMLLSFGVNKKINFIYLFLLSVLMLFLVGSRSTTYIFILSVIIYLAILRPIIFGIPLVAIVFSSVIYLTEHIEDLVGLGRMFSIIDFTQDQSFLERQEMRSTAIDRISENPFFGDYGGAIRDYGNIGAYAHDIISYWQQYGLIPFLLVVLITILMLRSFYKSILNIHKDGSGFDKFIIMYFPFVLIQMIFSRSYDWPFIWLLFGICASCQNRNIKRQVVVQVAR